MSSIPRVNFKQGKIVLVAVALLMCAALAACGSSKTASSPSAATAAKSSPSAATAEATPATTSSTASSPGDAHAGASTSVPGNAPQASTAKPAHVDGAAQRAKLRALLEGFSACARARGTKSGSQSSAATLKACSASLKSARSSLPTSTGSAPSAPVTKAPVAPPKDNLKPELKRALEKFAVCMRENGIDLPPIDSTRGAIFDTSHVNKNSPQFKAAETKCNSVLKGSF
jgi:hypothetical protein